MKHIKSLILLLCIVMLMSSTSYGLYNFGMYGKNNDFTIPGDLAGMGGNTVVITYDYGGHWIGYLNACSTAGIKCILSLGTVHPYNAYDTTDAMRVNVVSITKDHPAVEGYVSYDEPDYKGFSISQVETTYNLMKAEMGATYEKPIYISFGYAADGIEDYKNGYDIPVINCYRVHDRNDEITTGEFDEFVSGWSPLSQGVGAFANYTINRFSDFVEDAGKSGYIIAPQATGYFTTNNLTQRLLTPEEMRFEMYFPLLNKHSDGVYANGIISYGYHIAEVSPARSGNPYPYDGDTWLDDVYTPLCEEMEEYIPALDGGPQTGVNGVSDNQSDIHALLFKDGSTRYVLAVNGSISGTENTVWGANRVVKYTLGSNVPQYNCAEIRNDIEYSSTVLNKYHGPFNGYCAFVERDRTFKDSLSPFQVRAYKLSTASSFNLVNVYSGKAQQVIGSNVGQYPIDSDLSAQKWQLVYRTTSNGDYFYNIVSVSNPNKCLRPVNGSTAVGARVALYDYNSNTQNWWSCMWKIGVSDSRLCNYIINRNSNKAIHIDDNSDGTLITQEWASANNKNFWRLRDY